MKVNDKVFLDTNDGVKKRDKLTHEVSGAFEIKKVNKNNTVVIQRGNETELVTANRLTRAPASAPVIGPEHAEHAEHVATGQDLEEKNTEGDTYYFKKILDHRERDDGTLEFKLKWSGNWDPTWEPRANIPEESISRYLARVARKAKEKRSSVRASSRKKN